MFQCLFRCGFWLVAQVHNLHFSDGIPTTTCQVRTHSGDDLLGCRVTGPGDAIRPYVQFLCQVSFTRTPFQERGRPWMRPGHLVSPRVSQPTLNTYIRSSPDGWLTAKRERRSSPAGSRGTDAEQ